MVREIFSLTIFNYKGDLTLLYNKDLFEKEGLEIIPDESDFIGKKFNHLTVIARGPNYISPKGAKQTRWWCECDCENHNIILVRKSNLTSSNTKSCGCQNTLSRKVNIQKASEASKIDLTNQVFGELIAIKPTDERKRNSVVWECKCSCGRTHYVAANELNAHRIESCGCIKESKGIRIIKEILDKNNIPYITEKTFDTCRFTDTNQCARFDFYVDNKFLLEFDGIQHFQEGDLNYFRDSLEKRKEHDDFKNNWCREQNIPLKRIPYTALPKLSIELIMGDEYLI